MLGEFLKYTQVADGKIIALFQQNEALPEKAIALFNHVLNAQHIWASRILGVKPNYQVWEVHKPKDYLTISTLNFKLLAQILETVAMDKEITYVNSQGAQFVSAVQDILFHVFNHSTYHRAQIASLFKGQSIDPPVTDYIMLKRNGEL
jgi:uncharacterized damage-inducible protein DinB